MITRYFCTNTVVTNNYHILVTEALYSNLFSGRLNQHFNMFSCWLPFSFSKFSSFRDYSITLEDTRSHLLCCDSVFLVLERHDLNLFYLQCKSNKTQEHFKEFQTWCQFQTRCTCTNLSLILRWHDIYPIQTSWLSEPTASQHTLGLPLHMKPSIWQKIQNSRS